MKNIYRKSLKTPSIKQTYLRGIFILKFLFIIFFIVLRVPALIAHWWIEGKIFFPRINVYTYDVI